jgi:hypothetical protein
MNPNDVIEAFVRDVMRKVPAKDRSDIGLELRGLLADMLADRAERDGRGVDDAMTLAMLREFGTPTEVAARYRPQGVVIIPPDQTRSYALWSLLGVGIQWAITLPRVFDGQPIVAWWTGPGLGALWWPGFLMMIALLVAGLRHAGWYVPKWTPRTVDPDRVHRGLGMTGLVGIALGAIFMTSLPWLAAAMPSPFPRIFQFDAEFLPMRAWPAVVLWACTFVVHLVAVRQGRWTKVTRRIEHITTVAFIALMTWWIIAGPIFVAPMTDQGTKAALALVILISAMGLAISLYRERTQIRPLRMAG